MVSCGYFIELPFCWHGRVGAGRRRFVPSKRQVAVRAMFHSRRKYILAE